MTLLEKSPAKRHWGVVGLAMWPPPCLGKGESGFFRIGFDVQKEKCDSVNRGETTSATWPPRNLHASSITGISPLPATSADSGMST